MSEGYAKAKEVAEKIKEEVAEGQEKMEMANKEAEKALDVLRGNSNLTKMYQDNASLGAENLQGSLPVLKIHYIGKSSNKLSNGEDPSDGYFFYKPTGEQFKEIECHILACSETYWAKGKTEGDDDKFTQLLSGVIVNGGDMKPFLMYLKGKSLKPWWTFGKDIHSYTHQKPIPYPIYSLYIKINTEQVDTSHGKVWIPKFELIRTNDGQPKLVLDEGEMQYLTDSVEMVKDTMKNIIKVNSKPDAEEEVIHRAALTPDGEVAPDYSSDIPF